MPIILYIVAYFIVGLAITSSLVLLGKLDYGDEGYALFFVFLWPVGMIIAITAVWFDSIVYIRERLSK